MPTNTNLTGAGPFQFRPDTDLAVGESFTVDLERIDKGKYKEYVPFDSVRIINETTERIDVTYNGIYEATVPPNSVTSWGEQGVRLVSVTNDGTAAASKDGVKIEASQDPYDADKKARENAQKPWLSRALNDLVPGGMP